MSISIQDLINNPHLKTKLIAGVKGNNNEITWAHVCELEDPSTWLIGGELVMTNGFVIPSSPDKQVNYLRKLVDCKASGLAIGKDLHAPPLSNDLLEYADDYGFPILVTDYEIPWIAISKTVAVTNANLDYARVLQVMKLYDIIKHSINGEKTYNIIELISDTIGADIQIIDKNNKKVLYNTDPLKERISNYSYTQIEVPASRPVYLLIYPIEEDSLDTLIINHLSTIIGILIERDIANYERWRRNGSEILLGLIENQYSDEVVSMFMREHQLDQQELFLIACMIGEEEYNSSWLHIGLYEQGIPNFLTHKDNKLFLLMPANQDTLKKLENELPQDVYIGISKSPNKNINIKKMYKEAVWALKSAETLNKKIINYNNSLSISPFLPNSHAEAQDLVYDILGSLFDYDNNNNNKSEFVKTLYVFLSVNQSWKEASEILFIHKQTLVYRINRIEEILGKKLNNINNVSEIWIVLQIAIHLNLIPEFT